MAAGRPPGVRYAAILNGLRYPRASSQKKQAGRGASIAAAQITSKPPLGSITVARLQDGRNA